MPFSRQLVFLSMAMGWMACGIVGNGNNPQTAATGGDPISQSGGAKATGGHSATGGSQSTGGSEAKGGSVATGGMETNGGSMTGGSGGTMSGGARSGGTTNSGGVTSTGGSSVVCTDTPPPGQTETCATWKTRPGRARS